jgi:kinesin family protein 5
MTEKEKQIRETLAKLAHMKENSQPPSSTDEIAAQHIELIETKTQLAQQDQMIEELSGKLRHSNEDTLHLKNIIEDLQGKVSTLEREYQELLEKTIQEEQQNGGQDVASTIQDIKAKLEIQFAAKRESYEKELDSLRAQLARKDADIAALHT